MLIAAKERFRFGTKWFEPNTPVQVSNSEGLFLLRRGRVRVIGKEELQAQLTPPPVPSPLLYPPAIDETDTPTSGSPVNLLPSPLGFPDLRPFFKHAEWRVMPHSKGILIGSDFTDKKPSDPVFGVYKNCGFWTVNEVKILFAVAKQIGGYWLDIGGLTGWTAAHLAAAGCHVASLDPMYKLPEFRSRAVENLTECGFQFQVGLWAGTSKDLFTRSFRLFDGIVIDGDHVPPSPLQDATAASERVKPNGVILFHDANNVSVKPGFEYMAGLGWKVKIYPTSQGVALCYRDGFDPLDLLKAT